MSVDGRPCHARATWHPCGGCAHELRAVFDAATADRRPNVVERLNGLLARHRLSPSISGHDASDWHLHVAPGDGPLADDYAAGVVRWG